LGTPISAYASDIARDPAAVCPTARRHSQREQPPLLDGIAAAPSARARRPNAFTSSYFPPGAASCEEPSLVWEKRQARVPRAKMEITQGQREMQNTIKAAVASAKAATSMDPVKLIAQDGSEIIIDRRAALVSGTIKSMLAGPGVCVCVHSRGDAPANAESADYPWHHPSGSRSPLHARRRLLVICS
jgi:hypothetical protein